MALLNLRTDLTTGADTGGTWTYTGAFPISVDITGQTNPVNLNPNDTVPVGDDPELDFCTLLNTSTGLAPVPGTYTAFFTYTIPASGGCPADSTTVDLVVEAPPDAGNDVVIDICDDDAAFNLFSQLDSGIATDGVWSGTGIASGGYSDNGTPSDPTDDTFDPSVDGVGTYVFTYTIAGNPSANGCACADDSADITVNVTEAFEAGTGGTVEVCL